MLYLFARPVAANVIAANLAMRPEAVETALAWLVAEELILPGLNGWTTEADPWLLMVQTLEKRRERELSPALAVLGPWRSKGRSSDPLVARQAKRLLELVDDLAAIDAGTKRFSPQTLRRMVEIGGRTARFFDRRGGGRGKR